MTRCRAQSESLGEPRVFSALPMLRPTVVVLVVLTAAPALAQTPQNVERARTLFAEGSRHYQAGELNEALEDFLAAFRLVPGPELAYNIARTYERMGDVPRAIEFYRSYLTRAAPDDDERENVEARIAELEAMRRRQQAGVVPLPPSADAMTNEARTFFERGVAMYNRRNYRAALAAFSAAYQFARLPEVIFNLAVTSERLNERRDAAQYYREYARTLPRDSAERAVIEARIRTLRARR